MAKVCFMEIVKISHCRKQPFCLKRLFLTSNFQKSHGVTLCHSLQLDRRGHGNKQTAKSAFRLLYMLVHHMIL